jgi:Flp pilus assembly protein CpaB
VSKRRTMILVAAIVVGALAAFLVWGYVGGIQDRAYGKAKKVNVFTVKSAVTKGKFGEEVKTEGLIVESQIPQEFYPPNAIKSLDDIAGKEAINDLAPNQIVTTDMFADPATVSNSFADRLEKIRGSDQVAITISVSNTHGVNGLLQPGDYVNLMITETCDVGQLTRIINSLGPAGTAVKPAEGDAASTESVCDKFKDTLFIKQARYLYQKVQILAVDKTPVAQAGEVAAASAADASASDSKDGATAAPKTAAGQTGVLTLIVPARAAQIFASLSPGDAADRLYLTLVSPDYKPVTMKWIDPTDPLPAEDGTRLTPYGPDGPAK